MRKIMGMSNVIPAWYQVPIYLTNSTSEEDCFLYAWGEREKWVRNKEAISIHSIEEDYPKRFYKFFPWYENKSSDTAYLVGLRADESITRYRAVTKNPGYMGLRWSTREGDSYKFYPIYDFGVPDVWKFIYDYNLPYNRIYDLMYMNNYSIYSNMRVSNLIHEKSYKCLIDLPKYDPELYDKLCNRISGISVASRYASEKLIFSNKLLPKHYNTWKDFRDFLLYNIKNDDHRKIFESRFNKQEKNEWFYQSQVGQLLINDYENSRPFDTKKNERVLEEKKRWKEIL
jgi:predicted phosphoadenosine phosphosulfate sulfurtransferase